MHCLFLFQKLLDLEEKQKGLPSKKCPQFVEPHGSDHHEAGIDKEDHSTDGHGDHDVSHDNHTGSYNHVDITYYVGKCYLRKFITPNMFVF